MTFAIGFLCTLWAGFFVYQCLRPHDWRKAHRERVAAKVIHAVIIAGGRP